MCAIHFLQTSRYLSKPTNISIILHSWHRSLMISGCKTSTIQNWISILVAAATLQIFMYFRPVQMKVSNNMIHGIKLLIKVQDTSFRWQFDKFVSSLCGTYVSVFSVFVKHFLLVLRYLHVHEKYGKILMTQYSGQAREMHRSLVSLIAS